jgi:hypothetical protein
MKSSYDEYKLRGLEAFAEYEYFKGEAVNPYSQHPVESKWWNFENNYHNNYKKTGNWKSFVQFLDHWIKEIAAPGSGYDMNKGNWWKEEYEKFAPYADVIE